jgi:transcriptional regulator with GAF, ATPase, and Fis domain
MMILRHFPPDAAPATLNLSGPVFLAGSSRDNDAVLAGAGVPPVALQCEEKNGAWEISAVDAASWMHNGRPLSRAALRPGDRVEGCGHVFLADRRTEPSGPRPETADAGFGGEILDFLAALAEEKNLDALLDKSLDRILKLLQGTEAFLFALENGRPKAVASRGVADAADRFSDSIVQEALRGGGLALPNALTDARFGSARSVADLKLHTVVCAPILFAGRVTGVAYVGCKKPAVSYGEEALRKLTSLGQVLGLLVHHAEFLAAQAETLRHLARAAGETGFVAQCPGMQRVLADADAVAGADIAVLLHGETGTGKELFAQRLHAKSRRAAGPFVAVNCSSLKAELLESELFGYKRGAFTGALQDRKGLFAAAHGGTLFLDEIGEMDPSLQAKLLRALEAGKIRPVGGVEEELVDVRVVAATNRDLRALTGEGKFREDLYFRLAQVVLEIPPLRDREEDIKLLAYFFLDRYKAKVPEKDVRDFHPRSLDILHTHGWPGNVRELQSAVHKAVLLAQGPLAMLETGLPREQGGEGSFPGFEEATAKFQRQYLQRALSLTGGNREQAAKMLQMSRSTFFRYLSQLGVEG